MKIYTINAEDICTWDSFHDVFSSTFEFPGYYGRNMDAWNDCMSDRDEVISLHIENAKILKESNSGIFEALTECVAFINYRSIQDGAQPLVVLSYYV